MGQIPTFPTTFPPNCPPADAVDAEGIVFRQVRNDPPGEDDFLSVFEEGRTAISAKKQCQAMGLSVLRAVEDAVQQCRMFPKRGQFVARGHLTPTHGKTKLTSGTLPTHTTWWCYEGVDRRQGFAIMEGIEDVDG